MSRITVTPVVGLPQFAGWSQVAESTLVAGCRVTCVFSVAGQHAGSVGRDLANKIADFYWYDIEQLHDFLTQLVIYAQENNCALEFALSVLKHTTSVFATYSGAVLLRRLPKAGVILGSEGEIQIIQGKWLPEDAIVITTGHSYQFLSEIEQKFLQGYDADSIITSIVPSVHAQSDSSLSALAFITATEIFADEQELYAPAERDSVVFPDSPVSGETAKRAASDDGSFRPQTTEHFISTSGQEQAATFSHVMTPTVESSAQGQPKKAILSTIARTPLVLLQFLARSIVRYPMALPQVIIAAVRSVRTAASGGVARRLRRAPSVANLSGKKNRYLVVLTVLVAALIVAAFFWYSSQKQAEQAHITELLAPIESQAAAIAQLATADPIVAREQMGELIQQLDSMEKENADNQFVVQVIDKRTELMLFLESISGLDELAVLETFYDLRLIRSDFIASTMQLSGDILVVLDREKKQIATLSLSTKQVHTADFSDKSVITDVTIKDAVVYVLANGIYSYPYDQPENITEIKPEGDSNKDAKLIVAYDRYVYIINPAKRALYRYAKQDEGYSDPVSWMKSVSGIEYDTISSLSIDADVWLTTSTGSIRKFTSGRPEIFELRGIAPFTTAIYAHTTEQLENLYVLEPKLSRVVVIDKKGDFIREVRSETLAAANGVVASETEQKILVVSGSLIFELPLAD